MEISQERKRQHIFQTIRGYIEHIGAIDKKLLTETSSLSRDLNLDSLDRIELIAELGDEYGIEIDDEFVFKVKTVKDIIDYIMQHHAAKINTFI